MINVQCRARLTANDLDFLVETLDHDGGQRDPIRDLLTDADSLDRLLDDPILFNRLLEAPRLLDVSPYFFYYVLVRRAFLDHGIEDRVVADYVGTLLAWHMRNPPREGASSSVYLVDLVAALGDARTPEEIFALQTEVGDRALFIAGVFPDWIYHRTTYGRRAIGLSYYEDMGRRYYRVAAGSPAARQRELGRVLGTMADAFSELRQALNDLIDDHLAIGGGAESVDGLCRRALYQVRN